MGLEQDFPVKERAVPHVRVPAQRLEEWKEVAEDEIMRALSNRHSWYNNFKDKVRDDGYEMMADKPNLKAFVRNVPNTPDKNILVRSTLDNVTLDDLVSGFYCETTYDVRCAFAHMYEHNFLDGGILQAHERRTDEDPMRFVGVRWIAFRSPAPAIVTSRDFLYFSYEGTATDVDGNRVLFRFLRTMPMDDIPVDDSQHPPLVRGKISNLHLYRQNGSHVDGYTKAMHSNAGNMPSWVVTKTISFMFPGITNCETVCDARALLAVGLAKLNPARVSQHLSSRVSAASSIASHKAACAAANACVVCFHKFKLTRAKRRCQGCCREVCKRCTRRMWFFDELKQIADTGVVALRFCLNCMRQARGEVRESPLRGSFSTHRSSMSSNSTRIKQPQSHHHHHQQLQHQQRRTPGREQMVLYAPQPDPEPTGSYHDSHDSRDSELMDEESEFAAYTGQLALRTQHQHQQPPYSQQLVDPRYAGQPTAPLPAHGERSNKLISIDQLSRQTQALLQQQQFLQQQQLHQQQQQVAPPPSQGAPQPFRRQNSGGAVGWSHAGSSPMPHQSPLPPTPARGYPSAQRAQQQQQLQQQFEYQQQQLQLQHEYMLQQQRDLQMQIQMQQQQQQQNQIIPLHGAASEFSRHQSAPDLHAHNGLGGAARPPRSGGGNPPMHRAASTQQDARAAEDLEAIFRLRMMLFNENDQATEMSGAAPPRKVLLDGESEPQPQMPRY